MEISDCNQNKKPGSAGRAADTELTGCTSLKLKLFIGDIINSANTFPKL